MHEVKIKLLVALIGDLLRPLSEQERVAVISKIPFCKHCSCDDPQCQCWNDE